MEWASALAEAARLCGQKPQNGCLELSPLPNLNTFQISLHHLSELPQGTHRDRLLDHSPVNPSAATTASQQQTWLPSPAPAGPAPQPVFTQDFDLFQSSPTPIRVAPQASPRAPSFDSTPQLTCNAAAPAAFYAHGNHHSAPAIYSTQRNVHRSSRPPVPLFHSNSTGSLPSQGGTQQHFQQVTDRQNNIIMGGSEVNVAYEGTFGDLSSAGDAMLFDVGNDMTFDFNQLMDVSSAGPLSGAAGVPNGPTVSPKDVFNNDSVPPSTSFTNLTTPGSTFLETPDEDYQTSPLFDSVKPDPNDNWFSLFPDNDISSTTDGANMIRTSSSSSGNHIVVHPGGEANRKRSSTLASPSGYSPTRRHSSVAGVNARKRDKPLPAIVVDENDSVALKRARNTAAARKSRAKKVEEREVLEAEITDLKSQVEHWKSIALGCVTKIEDDE